MKKLLPLGLLLLFFSCVSKKQYTAKEQEVSILKKQLDSLYNNGLLDTDKDGIVDKSDNCPNINGSMSAHGCLDIDNDGIEDYLDKCPDQSGPRENFGCPWLDTDGDGITDNTDRCPSVSGTRSNEGCPEVGSALEEYLIEFCCSNHNPGHCATKIREMKELSSEIKCVFK
jgi:OOP family OmpA-OmpF porin